MRGRMNNGISESQMLRRICGEYLEMPGLKLTPAQARRLWGLSERTCATLLGRLVESRFLVCTADGAYVRLSEGTSPPRIAEERIDSESSPRARRTPSAVR